MENDKSNVAIGRPTPLGAIFVAPIGTEKPTVDPTTSPFDDLDKNWKNLGLVSEDGLTKTVSEEGDDIKAWGPEIITHSQTGYSVTIKFNLIETVRKEALEFVYGKNNVVINEDGTINIKANKAPLPHFALVVYTLQGNGDDQRIKRQYFGDAQITDRSGDETYNNSDLLSYAITATAFEYNKDGESVTHEIDFSMPLSQMTPVKTVTMGQRTANVAHGQTTKLTANIAPNNATNKNVRWSSKNPKLATVDRDGTVHGVAAGKATIVARSAADPSKSDSAVVTVT